MRCRTTQGWAIYIISMMFIKHYEKHPGQCFKKTLNKTKGAMFHTMFQVSNSLLCDRNKHAWQALKLDKGDLTVTNVLLCIHTSEPGLKNAMRENSFE